MKLFSGQFLLWHISPGHGFQLGAVVTRLTSAEGPGGNHPCWGSQGAFPAWMKGRQVEAGETLKESTGHTGSEKVGAVAFRGSPSDPSCFLGHEPPARGCPPRSPLPSGSGSGVAAAGRMWTFPPCLGPCVCGMNNAFPGSR